MRQRAPGRASLGRPLALLFIAATSPGLFCCAACDLPASSRLSGRWEGTIESDARPIAFFVDLAQLDTGEWVGEIDIPERPRFEATFTFFK